MYSWTSGNTVKNKTLAAEADKIIGRYSFTPGSDDVTNTVWISTTLTGKGDVYKHTFENCEYGTTYTTEVDLTSYAGTKLYFKPASSIGESNPCTITAELITTPVTLFSIGLSKGAYLPNIQGSVTRAVGENMAASDMCYGAFYTTYYGDNKLWWAGTGSSDNKVLIKMDAHRYNTVYSDAIGDMVVPQSLCTSYYIKYA